MKKKYSKNLIVLRKKIEKYKSKSSGNISKLLAKRKKMQKRNNEIEDFTDFKIKGLEV